MKTLTLTEILNYLSIEEVEDTMTKELTHESTENFLGNIDEEERWLQNREIYISNIYANFSKRNWIFYKKQFQKLNPKKLTIRSGSISCISGIETIVSLESVEIGDGYQLRLREHEVRRMLEQCFKLPAIKHITFFIADKGSGSVADHKRYIDRICEFVAIHKPHADIEKEYSKIEIKL